MMHRLHEPTRDSLCVVFVLTLAILPVKMTPVERCALTLMAVSATGLKQMSQMLERQESSVPAIVAAPLVQQAVAPSVVYASQAVAAKPVFQSTPKPLPIVNGDPWDEPVIAASTDNHFELMSAFCEEQRMELQNGGY